ncbi:MAG: tRNA uridine-5-carboxymethylaminomethyl(34) synthesis GTPase MnmE [Candidatus Latescibacteria bacterium]|nr:tRNA uridine-5-carboxymethylaminomethyl(34) synthesis GTPase MnmE [bacterium]MBD3425422.1 tRNA uridine-5-carboxymethylaminomethyl(34) synthesis GTPase MnmE [Candidatus Latescibacterota bacterium]
MGESTVVALSSPPGRSGIAVVRMSGPEAAKILGRLAPHAGGWKSHQLQKVLIREISGDPLDEVMAVLMEAPGSYTGEDVAEIYCHGSMRLADNIIEEAIKAGAEMAPPGEFTRRAFLNGKIDMAQAEAVADLICSETRLQSRVALEHLRGGLSRRVKEIEKRLLRQLVLVEGSIDFSQEEGLGEFSREKLHSEAEGVISDLDKLIRTNIPGNKLRDGIRVTLAGPRNAGKSSIYNALLGEERAIVSHIPGTTRDLLRERIHIRGLTYYLEDTAGIAETGCEIERRGIDVGREAARAADLLLFVLDGSLPLSEEDIEMAGRIEHELCIILLNKSDLGLKTDREKAGNLLGARQMLEVSAVTGAGLERLRELIYDSTTTKGLTDIYRERIAVNSRQCNALKRARGAMESALEDISAGKPAEILSVWLREAASACGEITGRSVEQDILEEIFSSFCIGK